MKGIWGFCLNSPMVAIITFFALVVIFGIIGFGAMVIFSHVKKPSFYSQLDISEALSKK